VLNSDFILRQARALAARLTEGEVVPAERIARAIELVYGRVATPDEIALGVQFIQAAKSGDAKDADDQLSAWEQYAQVLLSANEFMYID
jgi:hypothetical protein